MVHIAYTSRDYEKEKASPFLKKFSANNNQAYTNLNQKRQKSFHLWHNRVHSSLVHTVNQIFISHSHFIHFQSRVKQHDFLSLRRRYWVVSRLCTRFNYSDCKRSPPKNDNKLARNSSGSFELVVVSKTRLSEQPASESSSYPNQQWTMEMRDEVLSSVGAQDMETSGYQVSELDDVEFHWEYDQLVLPSDQA